MIIIGYPGIGKSTIAGKYKFIDLECSNFNVNGNKIHNWHIACCDVARDLNRQGFDVFVSSHGLVTENFLDNHYDVVTIFPSLKLKEEWVEKLRKRCDQTKLEKDVRAYVRAKTFYEDDISYLMKMKESGIKTVEIESMDYSLASIIENIKNKG